MSVFKKILVPTDFSENAASVFEYVRWLAKNNNAKVDLIHVIPRKTYLEVSEEVMGNPRKIPTKHNELREKLQRRLEEKLKQNIPEAHRGKILITDRVKVARGIVDYAEEKAYDLVVIGSRGKGKSIFKRGSVTLRLIRLSQTPVLSFNKKHPAELNNILMPTDGSKLSFEALSTVLSFAEKTEASIELLSVLEYDFDKIIMLGGNPELTEYAVIGQKKEILENLENRIEKSEDYSFVNPPTIEGAEIQTKSGKAIPLKITLIQNISAHHQIVEYADQYAELVIMTTHGKSGISKILLGSVAEKIVRHLEVPLLVIKPELMKRK